MEKAYVFDMGGVIKESFDLKELYHNLKTNIDFLDFKKVYEKNIMEAEVGKITSNEFLSNLLTESLSSKTIEEATKIYGKCTGNLYKDTMDRIYKLKEQNQKIYLLSNLKEIDFNFLKQKLDINIFTDVFLSYKLGCIKNSTKIFKIVIDKLQIAPNNIYFFDDKKENIANAKKVGINAYQVDGTTIKKVWNNIEA